MSERLKRATIEAAKAKPVSTTKLMRLYDDVCPGGHETGDYSTDDVWQLLAEVMRDRAVAARPEDLAAQPELEIYRNALEESESRVIRLNGIINRTAEELAAARSELERVKAERNESRRLLVALDKQNAALNAAIHYALDHDRTSMSEAARQTLDDVLYRPPTQTPEAPCAVTG